MTKLNTHFAPRPQKPAPRLRDQPTLVCVSSLAGIPDFVREVYGERILREANRAAMLDIERIEDQNCFIPHSTMLAFLDCVARRGREPNIGLLVAPHLDFDSYGVWSDYVLGAATLKGAIRRAKNTIGFHSYGDEVKLIVEDGTSYFQYRSASKGHPAYCHDALGTAGVMLSVCRHYLGDEWNPVRIELDLDTPRNVQAYEDGFHCPVVFQRPALAIVLRTPDLETRRPISLKVPFVTVEDIARARLAPESRQTLHGIILSQVHTQVLSGQVSLDRTAQALGMSVRTLQRELNSVGSSFRQTVNEMRNRRATELLREGSLSVAKIADQLGYSSSANFSRAFQRANGMLPTHFRSSRSELS